MADLRVLKLALLAETKGFIDGLNKATTETKSFGGKLQTALKVGAVAFAAIGTAAVAAGIKIGKDAIGEFKKFDQTLSDIGKATGASGAELAKFGDIARNVGKTVPQPLSDVGAVIGELNTRLGFTGEKLEQNTKLFLDYARINNTDVAQSTTLISKLVNALELDASDLEKTLGKLTKASQLTGINVDRLTGFILEAGPAFEEFGFGLDESIALFSGFEAAGARPEELLSSLNILMTRLAKQGVTDFRTGFDSLILSIKEAETSTQAVTIAAEAFGARVGAKVAEDIRAGRFEIEELVKAIGDGEGVIGATSDATQTFAERMAILKNQIDITKGELGQALIPILERLANFIQQVIIPRIADFTAGLTGRGTRSVVGATKETNSAFSELGIVWEDNDSAAFSLGRSIGNLTRTVAGLFDRVDSGTGPGSTLDRFINFIDRVVQALDRAVAAAQRAAQAIQNAINVIGLQGPLAAVERAGEAFREQTGSLPSVGAARVPSINVNVSGAIDPQATARTVTKAISTVTSSTGVRITAPAGFF